MVLGTVAGVVVGDEAGGPVVGDWFATVVGDVELPLLLWTVGQEPGAALAAPAARKHVVVVEDVVLRPGTAR